LRAAVASTSTSMQLSLAHLSLSLSSPVFKRYRDSKCVTARLRRRNLRQNQSSKVEGSLRAAAMRRKLISRLINYRSAGRLAQGDVSVVKRRLPTASVGFFERSERIYIYRAR